MNEAVVDYWHDNYVRMGLCCLCGNHGVLDTRGVRSPAGVACGEVVHCICPNGQKLRELGVMPGEWRARTDEQWARE